MLTLKALSPALKYIRNTCYRRNFSRPCSSPPKSSSPPCKSRTPNPHHRTSSQPTSRSSTLNSGREIDFIPATYDPDRVLPKGYMWVHSFDPNGEPDGLGLMYCLECGQVGDHIDKDCPNKDTDEAKAFQRKNFPELFK